MNKATRSIRQLIIIIFFYPFAISSPTYVEAAILGPSETIKNFQGTLLETMKNAQKTSIRQRYKYLAANVKKTFHFPLMVQIASGNNWQKASSYERVSLVNAFQRMSIMTLAALFDGYNGEVFKILGEKEGPQKTTLVSTELAKTDKSKISIIYVTRPFKDGWRIIDVIVDKGISELLIRRSEYKNILKTSGIPGLTKLLEGKAEEILLR